MRSIRPNTKATEKSRVSISSYLTSEDATELATRLRALKHKDLGVSIDNDGGIVSALRVGPRRRDIRVMINHWNPQLPTEAILSAPTIDRLLEAVALIWPSDLRVEDLLRDHPEHPTTLDFPKY